jgi:hypothetical protein
MIKTVDMHLLSVGSMGQEIIAVKQISNKPQTKILSHKSILAFSLLLLVGILTVGCLFHQNNSVTQAGPVADIMYLIPADKTKLEDLVTPDKLLTNQQELSIGVTSDWGHVNQLANEGKTKAVIIHHAAIDQVVQEELEYLFKRERFVVAGIGIPSNKLAEMVGVPSLGDDRNVYKTSAYFYIYSFRADGSPENIRKIEAAENIYELPKDLEGPLSGGVGKTTDSLLAADDSIRVMIELIEHRIWSINREDPYHTPPRPTIEIEELLKDKSEN